MYRFSFQKYWLTTHSLLQGAYVFSSLTVHRCHCMYGSGGVVCCPDCSHPAARVRERAWDAWCVNNSIDNAHVRVIHALLTRTTLCSSAPHSHYMMFIHCSVHALLTRNTRCSCAPHTVHALLIRTTRYCYAAYAYHAPHLPFSRFPYAAP